MGNKFNFSVEHTLTEGDILDVLTTAIEGGIGYWACLDNACQDWKDARIQWINEHKSEENPDPIPCYCDVAYQVMKNGKAVILIDEEEGVEQQLTFEKFLAGCAKYCSWRGKDIHKMMEESEFDAEDADGIIQFALFGEWIYG